MTSIISRRSGKFKFAGKLLGWLEFGSCLELVRVDSFEVERAGCACSGTFHDVEVNHGGFDAGMSQEGLDRADVGAGLE